MYVLTSQVGVESCILEREMRSERNMLRDEEEKLADSLLLSLSKQEAEASLGSLPPVPGQCCQPGAGTVPCLHESSRSGRALAPDPVSHCYGSCAPCAQTD